MIRWNLSIRHPGLHIQSEAELQPGEILGIHGPSGSGKSSLLRAIAGLSRNASGYIQVGKGFWLDTESDVSLAAHRRRVAYVAQQPIFFSHLDALGNIRFGRKRRHLGEDPDLLEYLTDILDLKSLLARSTDTLSGGEQQRLSLARALYSNPEVVLLDEPLTGLDDDRKEKIENCLNILQGELRIPSVFVSHHVKEHARLADRMMFINAGTCSDAGSIGESLLAHGMNVLDGIVGSDGVGIRIGANLNLKLHAPVPSSRAGSRIRVLLPSEQIHVGTADGGLDNTLKVKHATHRNDTGSVFACEEINLVAAGQPASQADYLHFNIYPRNILMPE